MIIGISPSLSVAEQSALWQQLFQHAALGMVGLEAVRNAEGQVENLRYRFINQVALRDTFSQQPGPPYDPTGLLITQFFPSLPQSRLWSHYLEVIDTQQPQQVDELYALDGLNLWVKLSLAPFGDGLLLSYSETSNSYQTNQALRQQSIWLETILNSSPDAIAVFETIRDATQQPVDFQFKLVNHVFETMTGQPASFFNNKRLSELYSLTDEQRAALIQLLETGVPVRQKELVPQYGLRLDGTLTRINDGFMATLCNITGEKAIDTQLEQQARLLSGIMHTVQNSIAVLEAIRDEAGRLEDYRYLEASQSLINSLKLSREQVIGQRILTILPNLRHTSIWPHYLRVLQTGRAHSFDVHYLSDGYDRHFSIAVAKLNDGLVVSYTDITATKQAQHQLETLVLELHRSNENLEQFAYVASHDLQEPLRKIVSFSDVLQQQHASEMSVSGADMVRRMARSAERMRTLVQDLLAYARITGHPDSFKRIDLTDLVNEVISDMDETIRGRRGVVQVTDLPAVFGDRSLLSQLVQNLLSNALKFQSTGNIPHISITGRRVDDPAQVTAPGVYTELTIKDNGFGFDEKYLDRLFVVFQRLHSRNQYTGTGIGLAICRKVTEVHGGAIAAKSQPDQGSTFTVWIPAG